MRTIAVQLDAADAAAVAHLLERSAKKIETTKPPVTETLGESRLILREQYSRAQRAIEAALLAQ